MHPDGWNGYADCPTHLAPITQQPCFAIGTQCSSEEAQPSPVTECSGSLRLLLVHAGACQRTASFSQQTWPVPHIWHICKILSPSLEREQKKQQKKSSCWLKLSWIGSQEWEFLNRLHCKSITLHSLILVIFFQKRWEVKPLLHFGQYDYSNRLMSCNHPFPHFFPAIVVFSSNNLVKPQVRILPFG